MTTKLYWNVDLWWRDGQNMLQAGAQWVWHDGDTWETVLEQVISVRKAPRALLRRIKVELCESE